MRNDSLPKQPPKAPIIRIGMFNIELAESVNCIKKYGFIETNVPGKWVNGFTEVRKLGGHRYAIKSTMANTYSVTNIEDMELFCKYYLNLNGY